MSDQGEYPSQLEQSMRLARELGKERSGVQNNAGPGNGGDRILFLALDVNLGIQRGDTVHAVELAAALDGLGNDVTFVVAADGPLGRQLPTSIRLVVASGSDSHVLRVTRSSLEDARPDVIYERRTSPKIGVAMKKLLGVPLVLEVNGLLSDELTIQGRPVPKAFGRIARERIRNVLMHEVDHFVVVSKAIGLDISSRYGIESSKISIVGNGVNIERFQPRSKRESCSRVNLQLDRPRAVFVGNLVKWRDLDTLISATPLIRHAYPELELVVIGDGPDRNRLEERARREIPAGTVRFLGSCPHADIPWHVCASDVCLLPAIHWRVDVSPLKLFEYLACGRPVVATDVPGLGIVRES